MKTKKWLALILAGVAVCGMMGCGSVKQATETSAQSTPEIEGTIQLVEGKWDDVYFNEEYKEEGMKTVKGVEAPSDLSDIAPVAGGGMLVPQIWKDCTAEYLYDVPEENQIEFFVFRTEDYKKMSDMGDEFTDGTVTLDEFYDAYMNAIDASFPVFGIYSINEAELAGGALFSNSDFGTKFAYAEKIGTFADRDYYFVYNDKVPADEFSEEAEQIGLLLESMDEVRENLILFPPHKTDFEAERAKDIELASGIDLSNFEATDLNGNTVTQDIFKDYDVTMINIWATWCGPCRSELPAIQAAYEKLPENANIISICHDAASETDLAKSIVEKAGLKYSVLMADEKMEETVFQYVSAFPTTIFVDSEGRLVGNVQIGVPSDADVTQFYLDLINSALGK